MRAATRVDTVRKLLTQQQLDAIVVRSTTDLQWLTGFEDVFDTEQAHTAVVTADACIIHTDSRYASAMRTAAQGEGLWDVDDQREGAAAFAARALGELGVAAGSVAIDAATPLNLFRSYQEKLANAQLVEREGDILRLRQVKEPQEIERMIRAQRVAEHALMEVLEKIHAGQTEAEVSLMLEFAMRSRGAQELAFANIVASGPNSANPHAVPGQRKLAKGDLVVIDYGARVDGYRSDTTRTVCIGAPSAEQLRIYNAVKRANEEVRRVVRAGVTGVEMHQLAEDILAEEGFAGLMGHGLGHGVGLDIHEEPCLNTRNDEPLPEGAVVTVEPGVYIAGQNGVRIEDCGQVTKDGFDNFCTLTHELMVVG